MMTKLHINMKVNVLKGQIIENLIIGILAEEGEPSTKM